MTLIAIVAATGLEVESFTTPPDLWGQWRKLPMGTFVIGQDRIPAVLKRSVRGLQFFAAAPGMAGVTAPESIEHQIAKIKLVLGMRAAGYQARVEQPGAAPSGEKWQADVLVQTARGPLAVEVQLAQQHWDEYRNRTARYRASGVSVAWLVRSSHLMALTKSKMRHLAEQGLPSEAAIHQAMDDMPWSPLDGPVGGDLTFRAENPVKSYGLTRTFLLSGIISSEYVDCSRLATAPATGGPACLATTYVSLAPIPCPNRYPSGKSKSVLG